MNFLEKVVRDDFKELLMSDRTTPIHFVIHTSGSYTFSVFCFRLKTYHPFAFLRVGIDLVLVENEFNAIKFLASQKGNWFSETVAIPRGFHTLGKMTIASYCPIKGLPMIPKIKNELIVEKDLRLIRKWLESLYKVPIEGSGIRERCEEDLSSRCDFLLSKINNPNRSLTSLFEEIKTAEKLFREKKIHKVINHGDLTVDNILFSENALKIVDWEYVSLRWPILDWFFFVYSYIFKGSRVEREKPEIKFDILQRVLFGKNRIRKIIFNETQSLMVSLSLDESLIWQIYLLGTFDCLYAFFCRNPLMIGEVLTIFDKDGNIFSGG